MILFSLQLQFTGYMYISLAFQGSPIELKLHAQSTPFGGGRAKVCRLWEKGSMKLEVLCSSTDVVEQPRNHTKYRKNFPQHFLAGRALMATSHFPLATSLLCQLHESMEHWTHHHQSYGVTSGDAHLHSVPLWLLPTSVVKPCMEVILIRAMTSHQVMHTCTAVLCHSGYTTTQCTTPAVHPYQLA